MKEVGHGVRERFDQGDGSGDRSGVTVGLERQLVVGPPMPRLDQRVRDEGQCPGVISGFGDEEVGGDPLLLDAATPGREVAGDGELQPGAVLELDPRKRCDVGTELDYDRLQLDLNYKF